MWDCSRGYLLELPNGYLRDHHFASMSELLDEFDIIGIKDEAPIDLKYMRLIARAPSWSPSASPSEGYPRLIRASYVDYLEPRDCSDVDIINPLAQLLRDAPKPPGKQVLDEVKALNALVGPVNDPRENTLESWLQLAQEVKVHLRVRRSLYLGDYKTMYQDAMAAYHLRYETLEKQGKPGWVNNPFSMFFVFLTYRLPTKMIPIELATPPENLRDTLNSESFREEVVSEQQFFENINEFLQRGVSSLKWEQDQFVSHASLEDWVRFKLLEVWKPSAHILDCEGCHQPFFSRREGKPCCHSRCRGRKKYKKDAESKRKKANNQN